MNAVSRQPEKNDQKISLIKINRLQFVNYNDFSITVQMNGTNSIIAGFHSRKNCEMSEFAESLFII